MGNYSLGSISGKIQIDYDGQGVGKALKDVDGLEKAAASKSKGMQSLLGDVGKGATIAGVAIAAGLAVAVNAAADFEKELSGIKAVSGATASEMDLIREAALRIGKDTSFSATEAAKAMAELSKAGISTSDILNGAADATVALAAAGGVDLPTAAEIAANALNLFNIEAKDMNNVVDKIAGAANKSAIDVKDFGMSMSQAGTAAQLVGLSFDDMAVAITAMGNAGIKGSDAGTSLKTMLLNLQPKTKEQRELFNELGITTNNMGNQFFTAEGKAKSLAEISGVLEKALAGMTDQQKLSTLETIFGSDAIRAASVVASTGKKGFEDLAKSIGEIKAADVAKTRMDNLSGSIEEMKGSLETAGIIIGTAFIPVIRKVADWIGKLADWFNNLSPTVQRWIGYILAGVGAALLLIGGIIGIVTAFAAVKAALAAAGIAFGAVAAAAGWVILIIIAIAVAAFLIIKYWKPIKAFFIGLWDAIVDKAKAVFNWFKDNFGEPLGKLWESIQATAAKVWGVIGGDLSTFGAKVKEILGKVIEWVTTNVPLMWQKFQEAAAKINEFLQPAFKWLEENGPRIIELVKGAASKLGEVLEAAFSFVGDIILAVWGFIKRLVTSITEVVQGIQKIIDGIKNNDWNTVFEGAIQAFGGFKGIVTNIFQLLIDVIVAIIVNIGPILLDFFLWLWGTAIPAIMQWGGELIVQLITWFWTDAVPSLIQWGGEKLVQLITWFFTEAIPAIIQWCGERIVSFITWVWTEKIPELLQWAGDKAIELIQWAWNQILEWLTGQGETIKQYIGEDLWNDILGLIKSAGDEIVNAITDFIGDAVEEIGQLPQKAVEALGDLGRSLYNSGKALIGGFVQGIRDSVQDVINAASAVTAAAARFFPFSPAKEGAFSGKGYTTYSGRVLMEDFAKGIAHAAPALQATLNSSVGMAQASFRPDLSIPATPQMNRDRTSTQPPETVEINVNNYNPVAETGTDSTVRALRHVAAFGLFS